MSKELIAQKANLKQYSIDKPAEIVAMATVLKTHIVAYNLYTNISNKNYVHVEGWQFAGFLLGIYSRVESIENLSTASVIKWKATVNLYQGDKIIGHGIALCSNAENKKKSFDEYAIVSMAQTRAIGKAYRNMIGWVMKLAGYEGTPSEEMKKMGDPMEAPQQEPIIDYSKPGIYQSADPKAPAVKINPSHICQKCGKKVPEVVASYSQRRFKKVLCRDDQPKGK